MKLCVIDKTYRETKNKIMKVIVDSKKGLKTNLKVFVDKKTITEKIDLWLNEVSK